MLDLKTLVVEGDTATVTGVGAVIRNGDLVLVQDHVKSGCWTIPVGKAEPGETYITTITRELKEEMDLDVKSGRSILEKEEYCVDALVQQVVFEITVSNLSELKNLEPEKHRELKWMTVKELAKKEHLTNITKLWLGL